MALPVNKCTLLYEQLSYPFNDVSTQEFIALHRNHADAYNNNDEYKMGNLGVQKPCKQGNLEIQLPLLVVGTPRSSGLPVALAMSAKRETNTTYRMGTKVQTAGELEKSR